MLAERFLVKYLSRFDKLQQIVVTVPRQDLNYGGASVESENESLLLRSKLMK